MRRSLFALVVGGVGLLALEGVAIILISSDFDEIEQLADRVEVMAFGRQGGELKDDISVDAIARLAFGASEARHA